MAVEVGGSEGGNGEGSGFGPVPVGAFQALGHELFAGGFDHARADLPAVRFGGGIVPVVGLVADVGVEFCESFARATATRGEWNLQPRGESFAATVVELSEGLVRPRG